MAIAMAETGPAELLTPEEVAQLLRLSKSKVYSLLQRNEIPGVVRLGRSVRVSRRRLEQWVASQG